MKKIFLLALLTVLILIFFANYPFGKKGGYVIINSNVIKVEIAESLKEKKKGLTYRADLCEDCGMLFVFSKEDYHSFWMKNTFIALDMVFINKDLKVVDLIHAKSCVEVSCDSYIPKEESLYVLEVNSYRFDNRIVGKKVKIIIED